MSGAAGAALRGPFGFLLQTQSGQWVILGLGAATLFPEKFDEIVRPVVRSLILGLPASFPTSGLMDGNGATAAAAPIVIQTPGAASSSASEKIMGQLIGYTVSAAGVWVSYTILINYLPDWAKEMLPVTRHVFDKAVSNLGKGIVAVSEKIQDVIMRQDETHCELLEARTDIHGLRDSLDSMENTLDEAGEVQCRTARGVKLLVRAVATMVPGHHVVAQDLIKYAKDLDIDTSTPPTADNTYNGSAVNNNSNNTYATPPHVSQSNVSYMGGKMITRIMPRTPTTTAMTKSMSSDMSNISEISEDQNLRLPSSKGFDQGYETSGKTTPEADYSTPYGKILPSSENTSNLQSKLNALLGSGKLI